MIQRIKCLLGFHDWRIFGFFTDPAWRIVWKCAVCDEEQLTPSTKADRAELDARLPPFRDGEIVERA